MTATNPKPDGPRIKPLAAPEDYRLWSVRTQSALKEMSAWDKAADTPLNTEKSQSFLLSVIADNYLEQILDSDLKAETIWTYLKTSILVSSVSAQSAALSNLMNFNYPENSMLNNKTTLLKLQRELITSFSDRKEIKIVDLVSLMALVNMPNEYKPLRTTLEETKDNLNLEDLFTSLIREESSEKAFSNRAARASLASVTPIPTATTSAICEHDRAEARCWSCHPELRPICLLCQKEGSSKFRHSKERCPKKFQKAAKVARAAAS